MSISSRSAIRTTVPVVATLAVLLLAPSAALAEPQPWLNRDPCAELLARATTWPGGFEGESGTVRLVSDAYVTHLSSQLPCASASGG